jgi:dTDP-4-dehydrorhamnose 3,5-epimerase
VNFQALPIDGAFVVESTNHEDDRGTFCRAFCADEFAAQGLDPSIVQASVSRTSQRGTLRGLHFQAAPHAEAKLVRCLAGEVWDVMVDLRPSSPSFGRWHAETLSQHSERAVYLPAGLAHGFQCLTADVVLYYQMNTRYVPKAARGVRFDDPGLSIPWPIPNPLVSAKDRALPSFAELFGTAQSGAATA